MIPPLNNLKSYTIKQYFDTPVDYIAGRTKHEALDIACPMNTPVMAVFSGKVVLGSDNGWGYHIYLQNGTRKALYAHLNRFNVKDGQQVKEGDIIGYSGSTGHSTGPHLHFELYYGSTRVDPLKEMEEELTKEQVNRIKIDTIEEFLLNRALDAGDVPAIEGRTRILTDTLNNKPINVALNERVDDIVANAQGADRDRLRALFNHLLSLIP